MRSKVIGLALLLLFPFISSKAQYRTVIDKEVGAVFQTPGGFSYEDYGAFIGSAPQVRWIQTHSQSCTLGLTNSPPAITPW